MGGRGGMDWERWIWMTFGLFRLGFQNGFLPILYVTHDMLNLPEIDNPPLGMPWG